MWEYNITTNIKDINYLIELERNIKNKYKNAIIATHNNSMTIALPYNQKPKAFEYIKRILAKNIALIYKERLLVNNINFDYLSEEYKVAFVKSLIYFDLEEDIFEIINQIDFDTGINFDSFYNFRLANLKYKWQQLILVCKSNTMFLESETFLELLKFLIDTIIPRHRSIDVFYNGKNFELLDENNNIICFNNTNNQEANLISGLISLAPKTINLHCAGMLSDNTFKIIYYIFNKKVNLLV